MLNGVGLLNRTSYTTTPVLCINYNLLPSIRYCKYNILLLLVIPGPRKYGSLDSFLHPLVEELKQLGSGVDAYNVYRKRDFCLRAWPVIAIGKSATKYYKPLLTSTR